MAHDSGRTDRSSRFHSTGSERGHAAPAADFASLHTEDEFDPFSEFEKSPASLADDLIDDLLPPEIDWRRMVCRHPVPALLLAGLGGYLLGRSQGSTLLRAISTLAVARVEAEVLTRIEDDLG